MLHNAQSLQTHSQIRNYIHRKFVQNYKCIAVHFSMFFCFQTTAAQRSNKKHPFLFGIETAMRATAHMQTGLVTRSSYFLQGFCPCTLCAKPISVYIYERKYDARWINGVTDPSAWTMPCIVWRTQWLNSSTNVKYVYVWLLHTFCGYFYMRWI